jgi:hypothetical protein
MGPSNAAAVQPEALAVAAQPRVGVVQCYLLGLAGGTVWFSVLGRLAPLLHR